MSAPTSEELERFGASGKADAPNPANTPDLPGYQETWVHERGQADRVPWNGYWWPFVSGGIDQRWRGDEPSPARKWDLAFHEGEERATAWEYRHHSIGESWYGHCDGYALASTVEPEPLRSVWVATAEDEGVCFRPNDLKALLAEVYSCDYGQAIVAIGEDCDQDAALADEHGRVLEPACRDVNPMSFHVTLSTLLGENRRAFYLDRSSGSGVWNYPVVSFASTLADPRPTGELPSHEQQNTAADANAFIDVTTIVQFAQFSDAAGGVAERTLPATYTYRLEVEQDDAGGLVLLGGEWTGDSRRDHPDSLKIPIGGRWRGARQVRYTLSDDIEWCNNPHIRYDALRLLVERSSDGQADEC